VILVKLVQSFRAVDTVSAATNKSQLNADKYLYESNYLDRWTTSGIDALIMPTTPWVGYKPWTWVKSSAYVGYTSIWNLLGYAALSVPITNVSREQDVPDQEWLDHVPRNAGDKFNKEQCEFSPRYSIYVLNTVLTSVDLRR
jgi:amidase